MLGLWVVHCPENQSWVELSCCQGNLQGHSCAQFRMASVYVLLQWRTDGAMRVNGEVRSPFRRHFLTMLAHQGAAKSTSIVYVIISVFRSHCLALCSVLCGAAVPFQSQCLMP
jgi:hypothetical protein